MRWLGFVEDAERGVHPRVRGGSGWPMPFGRRTRWTAAPEPGQGATRTPERAGLGAVLRAAASRGACALGVSVCLLAAAPTAGAADPPPRLGDYERLPLWGDLFAFSHGASNGQSPYHFFWFEGQYFKDQNRQREARRTAADIRKSGRVPMTVIQRWQDTYARSWPRSRFSGPGLLHSVDGKFADIPEFAAWARWVEARPQYLDTHRDGGSFPPEFRSWGGMHGNINPLMPLDPADRPEGMGGDTYGDLIAFRWAETAGKRGATGIGLSDFTDFLPHGTTAEHDFNPRIIAAFEAATGISVPGQTVPEKAAYILERHFNRWTDFWCQGWAEFFAALLREGQARTSHTPLVIDQLQFGPAVVRTHAVDPRIVRERIGTEQIVYHIDWMTMSPERSGTSMTETTRVNGTFAAYEPGGRFGGNLHSDHEVFWKGVERHWAKMEPDARRARALGGLKRLWLENGWLHVADRAGDVRRGMAFLVRTYWDEGKISDDILRALREMVPARPFGPALYYSAAIGRARENDVGRLRLHENATYFGGASQTYTELRDGAGIASGYFVSDAALPALAPRSRPSAWIVLERFDPRTGADLLPPDELDALRRTAPVLSTMDEIRRFPMPLSYSPGATGMGFYAADGDLVVTVSNTRETPQDVQVVLRTLPGHKAEARAIFAPKRLPLDVEGGETRFSVHLAPWDTEVFKISLSKD